MGWVPQPLPPVVEGCGWRERCRRHRGDRVVYGPLGVGAAHHLSLGYAVGDGEVGEEIQHIGILKHGTIDQILLLCRGEVVCIDATLGKVGAIGVIGSSKYGHAAGLLEKLVASQVGDHLQEDAEFATALQLVVYAFA